ncbi:MAG: CD3324 family protein [Oscillospiraceae bacterium]|nr:CD3324 family protein [Oscillospiraceae bacterium]
MQYKQAAKIFPEHLLTEIQKYTEGCIVYIPNKIGSRKEWGLKTNAKTDISERNDNIRAEYRSGKSLRELSGKYFLSIDTIKKILYSQ